MALTIAKPAINKATTFIISIAEIATKTVEVKYCGMVGKVFVIFFY